mgnify:FL=1|jgi:hypothetical protein
MNAPAAVPLFASLGRPLLAGGLICGVLDIHAAFLSAYLTAGRSPMWVLRAVASALLGRDVAFGGGAWVGVLGLGMHFTVAFGATLVFVLLSRKFPVLLRQAIPAGMTYGLGVYLFMNGVTIPLCSWFRSLYLHTPVNWAHAPFGWPQFGIHLTCVGLAISLAVRWATSGFSKFL